MSADMDAIASRLFGDPEPAPAPANPEGTADDAHAGALYAGTPAPAPRDDVPEAVQALRDTVERRLFDSAKGSTTFAEGALDLSDAPIDHAEALRVVQDLGASGADAQAFATLVGRYREGPDEETLAGWEQQATEMVAKEFTAADLELARKFVARDPRVHAYLHQSRLGSNPDVVRQAIELARQAKARGEL